MSLKEVWHAIFVITGEEDIVKSRLEKCLKSRDLTFLVPKRKLRERKNGVWQEKIRALFPGYVLVKGRIEIEDYYYIKELPGFKRVLMDKNEPLIIARHEIDTISKLINNDETISSSRVLIMGDRVSVIDGPLQGMEGLIKSINKRKGRAKVKLGFAGGSKIVELGISVIDNSAS